MPAVTRVATALVVLAGVLVPAPTAPALDRLAAQGFEAAGPWPGISSVSDAECPFAGRAADGAAHSGGFVLAAPCGEMTIAFSSAQAYVTLWAKTDTGGGVSIATGSGGTPVQGTGGAGQWVALTLPVTDPPSISQVVARAADPASRLSVDDVTFSTTAQPDTAITSAGPAAVTNATTATFAFDSTVAGSTFACALDGGAPTLCASPSTYASLGAGPHTFSVTATDPFGHADPTPARFAWRVSETGADSTPGLDATGTPSGASAIEPACSATANPGERDRDRDGLLDRCERLPSARLPVVAGVRARVRVIGGEVRVRLPRGTSGGDARIASARDGWVPLKGAAVLPMGSLVDARDGTLELDSARMAGGSAVQRARFGAGIFQIEQARRKQAKPDARAAPVELRLQTPPGAASACSHAGPTDVVRTLSASARGRYRMWGAVSTANVNGTADWTVSDRCDGTLTTVRKGAVRIRNQRSDGTAVVGSGGEHLVPAPLFRSLKGRG